MPLDSANQLDRDRLDIAQTQITEDFTTPPLIADWINVSNIVFPAIQEIIITKDIDIQARLDKAAADVEQCWTTPAITASNPSGDTSCGGGMVFYAPTTLSGKLYRKRCPYGISRDIRKLS